jgi:hypothetical protein
MKDNEIPQVEERHHSTAHKNRRIHSETSFSGRHFGVRG